MPESSCVWTALPDPPAVVRTHTPEPRPRVLPDCHAAHVGPAAPSLGSQELRQRGRKPSVGWDTPPAASFSARVPGVPGGSHHECQSQECIKMETEEGKGLLQREVASKRRLWDPGFLSPVSSRTAAGVGTSAQGHPCLCPWEGGQSQHLC